jgi:hypothetical protein
LVRFFIGIKNNFKITFFNFCDVLSSLIRLFQGTTNKLIKIPGKLFVISFRSVDFIRYTVSQPINAWKCHSPQIHVHPTMLHFAMGPQLFHITSYTATQTSVMCLGIRYGFNFRHQTQQSCGLNYGFVWGRSQIQIWHRNRISWMWISRYFSKYPTKYLKWKRENFLLCFSLWSRYHFIAIYRILNQQENPEIIS